MVKILPLSLSRSDKGYSQKSCDILFIICLASKGKRSMLRRLTFGGENESDWSIFLVGSPCFSELITIQSVFQGPVLFNF